MGSLRHFTRRLAGKVQINRLRQLHLRTQPLLENSGKCQDFSAVLWSSHTHTCMTDTQFRKEKWKQQENTREKAEKDESYNSFSHSHFAHNSADVYFFSWRFSVCVYMCESVCRCSEIDLLSLYFKLPGHTPPFATSEGCLFVDIKRCSVSFVIQIIIPISLSFDVYVAELRRAHVRACVCVHEECVYSICSVVWVCMCMCKHEHRTRYLSLEI